MGNGAKKKNCEKKKKVEASKNKHGVPTYEPRLYYYQQMDFLAPVVSLRKYTEQENVCFMQPLLLILTE